MLRSTPRRSPRLRLELLEVRATPSRTILVDDDRMQFPNADFTSIQAAVNAARSDTRIIVAPGTYAEQVVIPSGKDDLDITSSRPLQAVITAPAAYADASRALVHVNGARDVDLTGFTIR